MPRKSFELDGTTIPPGQMGKVHIHVTELHNSTPITLNVDVYHGKRSGPTFLVTAAIHGDELNGVEICRRLLGSDLSKMKGTLLVIPIVNLPGYLQGSRYLPDRRDLNRLFPGSNSGSLGGRIAKILHDQILSRVDLVVDLHTGAIHRSNLPQIRVDASNERALQFARAFKAPLIMNSQLRDGSFRCAGDDFGTPVLVYEAGEALRLDDAAIQLGLRGIRRVMRELGMFNQTKSSLRFNSLESYKSSWHRAEASGLVLNHVRLGQHVERGQHLATINQPLDITQSENIVAKHAGIVIGINRLATVYEGDALFHIARVTTDDDVDDIIVGIEEHFSQEPINEPES